MLSKWGLLGCSFSLGTALRCIKEANSLCSNPDCASANCGLSLHRVTCNFQLPRSRYERIQSFRGLCSSSSDSTLCNLSCSLWCKKKQLVTLWLSGENRSCLPSPQLAVCTWTWLQLQTNWPFQTRVAIGYAQSHLFIFLIKILKSKFYHNISQNSNINCETIHNRFMGHKLVKTFVI